MPFKFQTGRVLSLSLAVMAFALTACQNTKSPDSKNDFIIGKDVATSSTMTDGAGLDRSRVVVFDQTTRLIHEFDLRAPAVIKTLRPALPGAVHSVLYDQTTGLVVDLAEGHISLFDRDGVRTDDPLVMTDKARSFAMNAASGLLVVYDESGSVGLLNYNSQGEVINAWSGGSVIANHTALNCGDVLDNGTLALALADGKIAKINALSAINQHSWGSVPTVQTSFTTIKWLAPVHGFNDRVLVTADSVIALVSLVDGSILSQVSIAPDEDVLLKSKSGDAHVVLGNGRGLLLVYTDGATVLRQPTNTQISLLLQSRVSIAQDSWTMVDGKNEIAYSYNSRESEYAKRVLRKFRISDANALVRKPLPEQASIDLSEKYVFALFPDELGYAERIGINSGDSTVTPIRHFNDPYIK